jgi:glutamine synthetase
MIHIPLTVSFYKNHSRIYNSYILEYVWIDGRGNLRSKYRTAKIIFVHEGGGDYIAVENWHYFYKDGDEVGDEVALVPVAHFLNPFFDPGRAFIVLCDTHFRRDAAKVFESSAEKLDPWFRIEQHCFVTQLCGGRTISFRKLAYEYCLQAGLKISGINAEVAPSQWEFRIGPCPGLGAGDELWVARYILHKLAEEFGGCISFKSASDTLNTTFSTEETRNKNGLKRIYNYIDRLWKKHAHDDAGTGIRVPKSVLKAGCGHLEDRRAVSDADPHQVIAAIFSGAVRVSIH